MAAPDSRTASCKASGWVEPTWSLILRPFGLSPITVKRAPKSAKTWRALVDAEPFAASRATCIPSSWVPVETKYS